ncbi:hypothetical protein DFH27DRAFT_610489 [Peziza echinospora]|nr:hypothetical protein DFH27DRAFT_610489 [Peziza echinospora]
MKLNPVLTNLALILFPLLMVIMSITTFSAASPVPARETRHQLDTRTTGTQNIEHPICTADGLSTISKELAQISKRDFAPANAGAGVPIITPLYSTPAATDGSSVDLSSSVGWKRELLQKLAAAWRSSIRAIQSGGSRAWEAVKTLWSWFLNTFLPGHQAHVQRMKDFEARKNFLENHIRKASDCRFEMELDHQYHPPTLKPYRHAVSPYPDPDEEALAEFRLLTDKIKKKPQTIPIQIISLEPTPVQNEYPRASQNEPVNIRPADAPKPRVHEPKVYPASAPNEWQKQERTLDPTKSEGQQITLPEKPTRDTWRELHLLVDKLVREGTRIENEALYPPSPKPETGALANSPSNIGASTSGSWTPSVGSTSETSSSVYYTAPEWPSIPVTGPASVGGTGTSGTSSPLFYTPREFPGTPANGPTP